MHETLIHTQQHQEDHLETHPPEQQLEYPRSQENEATRPDWQALHDPEQSHQVEVRGENVSEERAHELRILIAELGESMAAYLSLPGVDANDPDLELNYAEHYITSYSSREEVLTQLGGTEDLQAAVDRVMADHPALQRSVLIKLDRRRVWERICETWDVVPGIRQWHIYQK